MSLLLHSWYYSSWLIACFSRISQHFYLSYLSLEVVRIIISKLLYQVWELSSTINDSTLLFSKVVWISQVILIIFIFIWACVMVVFKLGEQSFYHWAIYVILQVRKEIFRHVPCKWLWVLMQRLFAFFLLKNYLFFWEFHIWILYLCNFLLFYLYPCLLLASKIYGLLLSNYYYIYYHLYL